MSTSPPRPATEAPSDDLLERTHRLRQELTRRGEFLVASWAEEAAHDLKSGRLAGWYYPPEEGAPGLVFYSIRGGRAYAHAHVEPGSDGPARALGLVHAVLEGLPDSVRRADVGLSGLEEADEVAFGTRLVAEHGGNLLVRRSLERALSAADEGDPPSPFPGSRTLPVRSLSLDLLGELDWRSFRGTPDEGLIADTPEEVRRGLGELLEGRLGRFLDDASETLVTSDDRLVGALLAAEQTPRKAIVLDIVVDPAERRHGAATYLLRRAFRALRALGFERVRLWVTEANEPARRLYGRLGFVPVSVARIYRWSRPPRADPPHPQTDR